MPERKCSNDSKMSRAHGSHLHHEDTTIIEMIMTTVLTQFQEPQIKNLRRPSILGRFAVAGTHIQKLL